jgi:NRPS condensation-like uncharacterized protein
MANLQVKNVPADVYRKIQRHAKRQGSTIRDVVLGAVLREIGRAEFQERLAKRDPVELKEPSGRTIEKIRAEREAELE